VTRLPENLEAVREQVREQWQLEIFEAYPAGQCAWVAPARSAGAGDVVLKIGWPHFEAEHEADGLALWDGDGAVRLLAATAVDGTPALLLERCQPGTHLARLVTPEECDVVVAGLLRRLWRAPPQDHVFRPLAQMCGQWADGALARLDPRRVPDPGAVRAGIEMFRDLAAGADEQVVLFTDLHAGNVLAAEREPWLAIDPKPYVGDPTYDVLQHLLNVDRLAEDPLGMVTRMAGLLDLDPGRLRDWLFARSALEAVDDPAGFISILHQCARSS
jgi:streptomycin 6-kinase